MQNIKKTKIADIKKEEIFLYNWRGEVIFEAKRIDEIGTSREIKFKVTKAIKGVTVGSVMIYQEDGCFWKILKPLKFPNATKLKAKNGSKIKIEIKRI